jgi:uncharacterized damage-inducible protein DinB
LSRISHVRLMASYNASMNNSVYQEARKLPAEVLSTDHGAFFGSILGTLNHLVNADIIWLKRFANHPANYPQLDLVRALANPVSLGAMTYGDIDSLWQRRQWLDAQIEQWAEAITEADLDHALHYVYSRGTANRNFFSLLMHFFNHQTHHRGQAGTLLSQQGCDVGVTDLVASIPDERTVDDPVR